MRPRRRRRKKSPSKHLTVSATDDEWETVRSHATRRRLSIARYLVGLAARDGAQGNEGPPLALDTVQQRELLACHREIFALLEGDGSAPSLIADIQARIAVMFTLWARDKVDGGRGDELREVLARIVGEEQVANVMASVGRATKKRPRKGVAATVQPDLFS